MTPPSSQLTRLSSLCFALLLLAGCTAPIGVPPTPLRPSPTADPPSTETAVPPPTITPSPFPSQTGTPVPATLTPTVTPTVPPLPDNTFAPKSLLRDVSPVTYLSDSCQYLADRWGPGKAEPGTVVAPIMFHSITKAGKSIVANTQINQTYFDLIVAKARYWGFQTITISQLVDFLKNNTWIPPRSMILIVDDRRPGVVRDYFLPVLKQYDWTVTLAYISGIVPATEWKEMETLAQSGKLDVQAHGWLHNGETYFNAKTPEDIIHQEIYNPIDALKAHFGYRPTAFIWPGGDFTPHTVEVAREAGYEVGFTVYSRGPVMFNWVPLGKPEQEVKDPLMVLPRFWSPAALPNLDWAVQIGKEAKAQAEQDRAQEVQWYQSYCKSSPPLPTLDPKPTATP